MYQIPAFHSASAIKEKQNERTHSSKKRLYSAKKYGYFSCFSMKVYVMGTHQMHLDEALLMSVHNICIFFFCLEIPYLT